MTAMKKTCVRCGRVRHVQPYRGRVSPLCRDCTDLPEPGHVAPCLPDGTWENRAGVRVFVPAPHPAKIGRPLLGETFRWDADEARRAHSAYVRGERDDWAIEGERVYSRQAKQRKARARREAA